MSGQESCEERSAAERGGQGVVGGGGGGYVFFQAEDGIRDYDVTGVQTCALPISTFPVSRPTRSLPVKSVNPTQRKNCGNTSNLKNPTRDVDQNLVTDCDSLQPVCNSPKTTAVFENISLMNSSPPFEITPNNSWGNDDSVGMPSMVDCYYSAVDRRRSTGEMSVFFRFPRGVSLVRSEPQRKHKIGRAHV